jgi:hypothetical protein
MEGGIDMDMGRGVGNMDIDMDEEYLCPCGGRVREGEKLCDMCKYMNSIFNHAPREFESKRDIAMRAIAERQDRKMMVIK